MKSAPSTKSIDKSEIIEAYSGRKQDDGFVLNRQINITLDDIDQSKKYTLDSGV